MASEPDKDEKFALADLLHIVGVRMCKDLPSVRRDVGLQGGAYPRTMEAWAPTLRNVNFPSGLRGDSIASVSETEEIWVEVSLTLRKKQKKEGT